MRERLLDLLVCPSCKGDLTLNVFEKGNDHSGQEIMSGLLMCKDGEWYPIINGVPRMLRGRLKNTLFERYKDFFNKFGSFLPSITGKIVSSSVNNIHHDKKERTISSFGYEWTEFPEYENENFREWLAGLPPDSFFCGKVGLEVGCGAGRHTRTGAGLGAEMFAVDLSIAVDSAYKKNKDLSNVHIIQADLYALPFREGAFDFVYCLGVIQHLPDPPAGFSILTSYVRPGGTYFINVYAKGRVSWPVLKAMRFFITPLPNKITKALSLLLTMLDYTVIGPYKIMSKIDFIRPLIDSIVWERTKAYARLDFQANYADWFDRLAAPIDIRYGKEDVLKWYKDAGFKDILVTPLRNAFWNGVGRKPLSPHPSLPPLKGGG